MPIFNERLVFESKDKHSLTISFLGAVSGIAFGDTPTSREGIRTIVSTVFDKFLKSDKVYKLEVVTKAEKESFLIVSTFKELREQLDKSSGKHLELRGVLDRKKRASNSEVENMFDILSFTNNEKEQLLELLNFSDLFIGFPSSFIKKSLDNVIRDVFDASTCQLVLHTSWRVLNLKKATYFDDIVKIELKKRKRVSYWDFQGKTYYKSEDLKNRLLDIFPSNQKYNPILAIDFSYLNDAADVSNGTSNIIATKEYKDYKNEFYNDKKDILYLIANLLSSDREKTIPEFIVKITELQGYLLKDFSLENEEESLLKKRKKDKPIATFEQIADFFGEKKYGQMLVWVAKKMERRFYSMLLLFNNRLLENERDAVVQQVKNYMRVLMEDDINAEIEGIITKLEITKTSLYKQSVRSALSQVFVRNMAHNIISHVLVYLQSRKSIAEIQKIISKKNAYQGREVKKEILDKDYQIAVANQYVSDRCLYLNEATYGVANNLTMKKIYGDLFTELDENRILLNLISGISNFSYSLSFKYNGIDLTEDNDRAIMLPADTLGQQAFYNIIENIIRNTAKHNPSVEGEKIVFVVNFDDRQENEYYNVNIYPKLSFSNVELLRDSQNKKIKSKVIKNDRLREESLGMLEMKASAAFLRQVDTIFVEDDLAPNNLKTYSLLEAKVYKNEYLAYSFYVRKPEKYLVITSNGKKENNLEKFGVRCISVNDFKERLNRKEVVNAEFVLLTIKGSLLLKDVEKYFYTSHQEKKEPRVHQDRSSFLSLLPERLMYVEETWVERFFDKKEGNTPSEIIEAFELAVWEQWEGKRYEKINDNWECFQYIGKNNVEGNSANVNYDCCKQVIFHNHLSNKASWITLSSTIDREKVAVEPLSSAALRKMPQYRSGSFDDYIGTVNYPEKTISPQLIEAYFSKILVIEERIQDFSTEKYPVYEGEGVSQGAIYEATHILLPTKETLDLKANDLKGKTIDDYISVCIQEEKPEFLLIHYGLMERIYGKENGNKVINQRLEEWSKKLRVVVTSGRGKHSLEALPESVCYLNLSSVLKAFKEDRNKYSIHYILNQARR